MSVIKCLMQKAEAGLVSRKTAQSIADEIDSLKLRSAAGDEVTKELESAQQAFEIITNRIGQKAKQVAMHADLVQQGKARFSSEAPVKAVLKSFSFADEAHGYKYGGSLGQSAEERIQSTQRVFVGMAADILDNLNPKRVGMFQDPAKQLEIRKDLFSLLRKQGERSKDAEVRKISEQIADLTTKGGQAFERAGGNITMRSDHMLGRTPVREKISKVPVEEYVKDSLEAYDLDRVRASTDGVISTYDQLKYAIEKDYQSIKSGGLVDLAEFAPAGAKSVVNSRNHHRIFHFKDADAMDTWQQKYGTPSLFENVYEYASNIGKDIGTLETYGPKPEAFIRSMLREAANIDPVAAASYKKHIYRQFRYVTGQWDRDLDPTIERYMGTYKQLNVSNKLGATMLSAAAVDTFGLTPVANRMRGLPVLKTISQDLKYLFSNGLMEKDKKEWAKLGWINEAFINDTLSQLKNMDAGGGAKLTSDLAQGVMKYSLLTRKTNSAKGAEVMVLGSMFDKKYSDLPNNFKNWMKSHGVDEEVFTQAQELGMEEVPRWGIKAMSPVKLFEDGHTDLSAKIGELFGKAPELSSPTQSPELKAFFADAKRGGKLAQVGFGSSQLFSGYLGSFINNHARVMLAQPGYGNKLKWTGAMITSLWAASMVDVWMRDMIMNGKSPALDRSTVLKAAARANLVPILGDFLTSGSAAIMRSPTEAFTGAILGDAITATKVGAAAIDGNLKQVGAQTQKLLENLIPGKTMWFSALALRRTVLDQLRYLYDPEATKYFSRKTKDAAKTGTPFWWAPGQMAPSSAPDLGNLLKPTPIKKKRGK